MTPHYVKKRCDRCNKDFNKVYATRGRIECWWCHLKDKETMPPATLFEDEIKHRFSICIGLTERQHEFLGKNKKKLSNSQYFRELLLKEMGA